MTEVRLVPCERFAADDGYYGCDCSVPCAVCGYLEGEHEDG